MGGQSGVVVAGESAGCELLGRGTGIVAYNSL